MLQGGVYKNAQCVYYKHVPGAVAFKTWSMLDLEYFSRIFMLQEHMLLEQLFGPKSHRSCFDSLSVALYPIYIINSVFFFILNAFEYWLVRSIDFINVCVYVLIFLLPLILSKPLPLSPYTVNQFAVTLSILPFPSLPISESHSFQLIISMVPSSSIQQNYRVFGNKCRCARKKKINHCYIRNPQTPCGRFTISISWGKCVFQKNKSLDTQMKFPYPLYDI